MAFMQTKANFASNKRVYESAIARRRQAEETSRQDWGEKARYFQRSDINSSKENEWSSNQNFLKSMSAYKQNYVVEPTQNDQRESLSKRRMKLSAMITEENKAYQEELKALNSKSTTSKADLTSMRQRANQLKSDRESARKQDAEDRLYKHWVDNQPELRQVRSETHQQHVVQTWPEQMEERRQRDDAQREDEMVAMEMDRMQLEEERMRRVQERAERRDVQATNRAALTEQMARIKQRESEADHLNEIERELMTQEDEIERMRRARQQEERDRQNKEHGRVLLKQHVAGLRRRSAEVAKEVEADLAFLDALKDREAEDHAGQRSRRQRERADAAWMRQMLADQLRTEQLRQAEFDDMIQEEAVRKWRQQEEEWASEREKRQRLLDQVLEERAEQVRLRLEATRARQQESVEEREHLLDQLATERQQTARERQRVDDEEDRLKRDQLAQVTQRQSARVQQRVSEQETRDAERVAERQYEQMLADEAQRIRERGYPAGGAAGTARSGAGDAAAHSSGRPVLPGNRPSFR